MNQNDFVHFCIAKLVHYFEYPNFFTKTDGQFYTNKIVHQFLATTVFFFLYSVGDRPIIFVNSLEK